MGTADATEGFSTEASAPSRQDLVKAARERLSAAVRRAERDRLDQLASLQQQVAELDMQLADRTAAAWAAYDKETTGL
jgi:hypothetical protein